jgi:hypothetical protein
MIVTFFLKLGTFFINYFGQLDTLINTLAYVRNFDILCINKLCQIGQATYYPFIKLPHCQCQVFDFFLECIYGEIPFQLPVHKI